MSWYCRGWVVLSSRTILLGSTLGRTVGSWHKPETDRRFTECLKSKLRVGAVKEFDLHINDQAFADVDGDGTSNGDDVGSIFRYIYK